MLVGGVYHGVDPLGGEITSYGNDHVVWSGGHERGG
jgi:hypothetical protein